MTTDVKGLVCVVAANNIAPPSPFTDRLIVPTGMAPLKNCAVTWSVSKRSGSSSKPNVLAGLVNVMVSDEKHVGPDPLHVSPTRGVEVSTVGGEFQTDHVPGTVYSVIGLLYVRVWVPLVKEVMVVLSGSVKGIKVVPLV